MTERERWEELLSQKIPVMVTAPFTGEPMCIDCLHFGVAELESFINFLILHGAILPPCKIGDHVKFTRSDEIWRVDCLHFYREGQPQISITRENVTHTITFNMFVNSGGKVICRKQEVNTG